jgi:hypothetical protein
MERHDQGGTIETTMLELVDALAEEIEDDREIVAAVCSLLRSGRLRLIGTDSFPSDLLGFDADLPPKRSVRGLLDRRLGPERLGQRPRARTY